MKTAWIVLADHDHDIASAMKTAYRLGPERIVVISDHVMLMTNHEGVPIEVQPSGTIPPDGALIVARLQDGDTDVQQTA